MAGASVSITVDDAAFRSALAALGSALKDPRRALQDVGEYMLLSTDQHFRDERGPDGVKWPDLSSVTLLNHLKGLGNWRFKSEKGSAPLHGALAKYADRYGLELSKAGVKKLGLKRILRDSGMLQDTIRYQLTADGQSVEIGTDRKYGAMQQFGGTRAQWPHLWGDIPPRPFLGVSARDREEVLAIFRRHLLAGL